MVEKDMEVRYHNKNRMAHRIAFNEADFTLVYDQVWNTSKNALKIQEGILNDTVGYEYHVQIDAEKPVNIFCAYAIGYGYIDEEEMFNPSAVLHEDYLPAGSVENSRMYTGAHINQFEPTLNGFNLLEGYSFRYNKDFVYGDGASDDDFSWTDTEELYILSLYSKMLTDCFVQKAYGINIALFAGEGAENTDVNIKIWKKSLGAGSLVLGDPQ